MSSIIIIIIIIRIKSSEKNFWQKKKTFEIFRVSEKRNGWSGNKIFLFIFVDKLKIVTY